MSTLMSTNVAMYHGSRTGVASARHIQQRTSELKASVSADSLGVFQSTHCIVHSGAYCLLLCVDRVPVKFLNNNNNNDN